MTSWLADDGATLMAVVNVNADSFSDPRAETDPVERLAAARAAVADGAAVVDLGAESAALAAALVPADVQAAALAPIVAALHAERIVVSVDTHHVDVVGAVLHAGASIVNDFSGQANPDIVAATAAADAWYVLTHNPVGPRARQTDPDFYTDVVDEVTADLERRIAALVAAGMPAGRIVLDPGVDAGKTPRQSLALLRGADRLRARFDQPLLWAISRKDVLGALTGRAPADRDAATLALLAAIADHPRTLARVHAVPPARDWLAVHGALAGRTDLTDDLLDDQLRRQQA